MNLQIVTVIFIILVLEQRCTDAVFNGSPANIINFPYMAALCYFYDSMCSGAIIGERHYLTAGHCIFRRTEPNHYIVAGAASLLDPRRLMFPVKKFHIHPNYTDGVYITDVGDGKGRRLTAPIKHDIAIIEIQGEFPLKQTVGYQPSGSILLYHLTGPKVSVDKVPWATEPVGQCIYCAFAGWGSVSKTFVDISSFHLLHMRLYIRKCNECPQQTCQGDPYTFCTYDPARTSTPGRGDSGGPLVCNGVVAGVYSNSRFDPEYPVRFTNVVLYNDWIESIVPTYTKL